MSAEIKKMSRAMSGNVLQAGAGRFPTAAGILKIRISSRC